MDPIWPVLSVSLIIALVTTIIVMALSIVLAVVFVKSRSFIVRAIEMLIYLPMALPPVAVGYGLLLALGRNSLIGRTIFELFQVHISFTMVGAIIAACTVSLGIGVRTIRVALMRIDTQQGNIASLLGATNLQILWHIYLPQCRPAILGASVLVFIRALSEFGATMIVAGNTLGESRTLALAIWIAMETPGQERQCMVLVVIAVTISCIAMIGAELLLQKSAR